MRVGVCHVRSILPFRDPRTHCAVLARSAVLDRIGAMTSPGSPVSARRLSGADPHTDSGCRRFHTVIGAGLVMLAVLAHEVRAQVPFDPVMTVHLGLDYGLDFFGARLFRPALQAASDDGYVALRGAVSTRGGWLFDTRAERRLGHSPWRAALWSKMSSMERNRFHGSGNLTDASQPSDFYLLEQRLLDIGSSLLVPLPGYRSEVSFGPVFRYVYTGGSTDTAGTARGVIALLQPYGAGEFSQFGFRADLSIGTVEPDSQTHEGIRLEVGGRAFPAWMDLQRPFGSASATLSIFGVAPTVSRPTLALRLGAERVFGNPPFYELAYVGGKRSLRGFRKQRFGGDLALFIDSELRLHAWRFSVRNREIEGGPLALLDAGRVYVDGLSEGGWHVGAGGGIWLLDRRSGRMVSAAVASSQDGIRAYAAVGFPFWP